MISFISSLEIIFIVVPDSNIFLEIVASAADAAVVNPNEIKTLLANGLSTFLIKYNPDYSNSPKSLPINPPDYSTAFLIIFILADALFPKALRSLKTGLLVNNNLCEKLFSSLEAPATCWLNV